MNEAVMTALVTGLFGLIGSVIVALISSTSTRAAVTQRMEIAQAVTDTKLDELTREVRAHNDFARRVPVLEEQIKAANHRLEDLERRENDA